jgi:hypothetical protein
MISLLATAVVAAVTSYAIARPMQGFFRMLFALIAGTLVGCITWLIASMFAGPGIVASTLAAGSGVALVTSLIAIVWARQ